jgi:hypothetical protein
LSSGSGTGIAGTLTNNGILRAAFNPNTIEYNGTNQTIINPNGLTPGYYNLILSGSGTKTMPGTALNIAGDFTLAGTASTTATETMTVLGKLTIGNGTNFGTGGFDHLVGGDFINNGTFSPSSGCTIMMNGSLSQAITGTSTTNFDNLDIDNILGVNLLVNTNINNILTLTNGNLSPGGNTLGINGTITNTSGYIDATVLSSLYFGGTTAITIPGTIFTAPPSISNLTINRTGGVTFACDVEVGGILNLQSVNPSATKGSLDTWDGSVFRTLTMGPSATTVGAGDVTGIVKRTSFTAGIPYSFGNQFTTLTFDASGTFSASISLKIRIGTSPSWKPSAIARIYDFIQSGGGSNSVTLIEHYLDSELNGNAENNLALWLNGDVGAIELGRNGYNSTDNWVALSNMAIGYLPTSFGTLEFAITESEISIATWNGSISTSWIEAANWTPSGAPTSTNTVYVPDATTTVNDPTLPASTEVKGITLYSGGVLNSGTNSQLTINGPVNAWNNQGGTFNAGNSTVIFTNASGGTIDGATNFYNITIISGAILIVNIYSETSINGAFINNGEFSAGTFKNKVVYNGSDQTIINPNGLFPGYQDLILSGSGTKTMPGTAMNIAGDFSLSGTVSVIANNALTLGGDFTIGASTNFTTGSFNHSIGGFLENNGSFTATGSSIAFNGTVQTIGGTIPVAFNNLTVATGSNTTINTPGQTINGKLLCNGTLNSGGNITLLSTATQTALIDGTGTGQVLGNVTMQRYIPSGFGYKYISSPFQSATVNEFADDIDLAASSTTFYSFNENRYFSTTPLSGWVNYKTTTNILYPLSGYAVNLGSNSAANTIDITEIVNNGSYSATLYNHDQIYTKGFNLVGNPYPSPIDWNASSGWTKTNIDNSLYFFKANTVDQYGGTYSTYINGSSSDGIVDNIIPSMQGFFVHVSDGTYPVTGTLAMNNDVRITNFTHPFTKSMATTVTSLLRVVAGYSDNPASYDPTVLYFDDKATYNFDGQLDALKLYNTDASITNFYSISANSYKLSINALPIELNGIYTIPLGLKTARDGEVLFKVSDSQGSFIGKTIYLSDAVTGVNQDLQPGNEYRIYLVASEYKTRFFLNLTDVATPIPDVHADNSWFSIYAYHGILKTDVDLPEGQDGILTVFNLLGQPVFTEKIYKTGHYEFNPAVKDGFYLLSFVSGDKRITERIIILNE